jgi:hypothetical protein
VAGQRLAVYREGQDLCPLIVEQWDGCLVQRCCVEFDAAVVEEAGEPVPMVKAVTARTSDAVWSAPRALAAKAIGMGVERPSPPGRTIRIARCTLRTINEIQAPA